jgi:hypothetical protein
MIVGFPYQTPEIIEQELSGLLALRPVLTQFLIYGPCPGTPFYDEVIREGKLLSEVAEDPELFYRRGSGFYSMVRHPSMTPEQIEGAQKHCYEEDFRTLGPVLYRSVDRWLEGYLKLRESPSSFLRAKAERIATDLRKAYPVFLTGRLLGPTAKVRRWIGRLQKQVHAELGSPTWTERIQSVAAVGLASWTALTLRLGLFQHPPLVRNTFRMSDASCGRAWERLRGEDPAGLSIQVERRPASTVWVLLEGRLTASAAGRFVADMRAALARRKDQVVLDLAGLAGQEDGAVGELAAGLRGHRDRIRIILPRIGEFAVLTAIFRLYQ